MENYKLWDDELLNQLDEIYQSPNQESQINAQYDYDSPQTIVKLEESLRNKKSSGANQKPISQSILNLEFDDGTYSCSNTWECIYCNAINEYNEFIDNITCIKCNKNRSSPLFTSYNHKSAGPIIKSNLSNINGNSPNMFVLNNDNYQKNNNANNIFIYTPQLTLENKINNDLAEQCTIPDPQFQNKNGCQYAGNYKYINNETSEVGVVYEEHDNNNTKYENPIKNDMNYNIYNNNNNYAYNNNNYAYNNINFNYKNYNNNIPKNNLLNCNNNITNNNNIPIVNPNNYQPPVDTSIFGDNIYPNFNYHRNINGGKGAQKNRTINRTTQFTRVRCKNIARVCHRCGTNTTPKWRRAPPPNRYILCNACGLQCNKDIDTNMNDSNIDVTCFCQGKFCVEAREQGIYLKRRLFNRKLKLCFYCNKERRSQEMLTMNVTEYLI